MNLKIMRIHSIARTTEDQHAQIRISILSEAFNEDELMEETSKQFHMCTARDYREPLLDVMLMSSLREEGGGENLSTALIALSLSLSALRQPKS